MKKFTGIILAAGIVFFIASGVPTLAKKKPGKTNGNYHAGITYVVEISPPNTAAFCHDYRVVVRDGGDNPVGPPILYQPMVSTYVFHESGPATGIRVARLERVDNPGAYPCHQGHLRTAPDKKSGEFRNGLTYLFYLHPQVKPGHD